MPWPLRKLIAFWLVLLFLPRFLPQATAQRAGATSALLPTTSLRQLTRNSGYIFAGIVTAVERVAPARPHEVASMRISFRVEHAIRGVRTGETLVIREWAGLWESGERYHRGERVLLFLYRPSKLGLTSPVGGPLGRFPLDSDGWVILDWRARALSSDSVLSGAGLSDRVLSDPGLPDRVLSDRVLSDPAIETSWGGRIRVSRRDFVRAIRRATEE
jgi:hypothetical protein